MPTFRGTTAQNPGTTNSSCSRDILRKGWRIDPSIVALRLDLTVWKINFLSVFILTILYESREAEASDQLQSYSSAVLKYSSPLLESYTANKWINTGATNWPNTTHSAR